MTDPNTGGAATVAEPYRHAVEAADLDAIADLLDPLVRWGPAEWPDAGCRTRKDALRHYRQGKAAGASATVTELSPGDDKMLVALRVTGMRDAPEVEVDIWQAITVRDDKIVDISGCPDRETAARLVGID